MKRIFKISAVVLIAAMALCSCVKEGAGWFKGNYSFKTSGTVSFREKGNESAEVSRMKLTDELGQMDILKSEDNRMFVTMNILSGSVVVFDAEVDGKVITLLPKERTLSVRNGVSEAVEVDVVVSGTGRRYGDSVIFGLTYDGAYESDGVEYEIVGSDVECVAKMN